MDRGKITNNINDFPNESTALISISAEDMTFSRIIGFFGMFLLLKDYYTKIYNRSSK